MLQPNISRSMIATILLSSIICLPRGAHATIVEFETTAGTFQVNLYDLGTPATVANFLNYVNNGAYTQSIIHRSMPGFVIQGGGYVTNFSAIPQNPAVVNEPVYSNVRGTIAMAKTASGPSTATNQWFFNLTNSAANLDNQNGGFTAFGQVTGNGMATVDAIAAIPTYNKDGVFTNIPLQNYTTGNAVVLSNLVVITSVTVMDPTVDSAAGLSRPLTTRTTIGGGGNGGGGGSFDLLFLIGLLLFGRSRFMRS